VGQFKATLFMRSAPVKAPFSYPNSSLSRRVSGSAPQLTAMKGLYFRELLVWMALATSSLPVPVSPLMKTVALVSATVRIISKTFRMALLFPMMFS